MKQIIGFALALTLTLGLAIAAIAAGKTGSISGSVDPKFLKRSDVLVYIDKVDGAFPTKDAEIDQMKLTFIPRITPIVVGSTIIYKNSDDVNHNVNSPDNEGYDLGVRPKGVAVKHVFGKTGVYTQLCNVHPEMCAYVVVLQNPFWASVKKDGDGAFTITNVPAGKYSLKIWGEGLKKKDFDLATPVAVESGKAAAVSIVKPKKEEAK